MQLGRKLLLLLRLYYISHDLQKHRGCFLWQPQTTSCRAESSCVSAADSSCCMNGTRLTATWGLWTESGRRVGKLVHCVVSDKQIISTWTHNAFCSFVITEGQSAKTEIPLFSDCVNFPTVVISTFQEDYLWKLKHIITSVVSLFLEDTVYKINGSFQFLNFASLFLS